MANLEDAEAIYAAIGSLREQLATLTDRVAVFLHENPPGIREALVVCPPGSAVRVQWMTNDGSVEHEVVYQRPPPVEE